MKYTDYFSNFYMGRSSGGILGHKSKEKIPEYFFKAALLEEYYDLLPTSNSAYGKWFDGIRKPEGVIWGTVVSHFDENGFIDNASKDLNDSALRDVTLRISSAHKLTDRDKEKIKEYLENVAVDGIVHETSNTSLAAMYWHVK